jgi:endonuclease/exonuclease/phosphatase family metal-dependent hydrolase
MFNPTDNADWNLAYLFKTSEMVVTSSSAKLLFPNESFAFPREPFEIKVKHIPSDKTFYLINLHLKCCGGNENEKSRRTASRQLKNYLDTSRPGDAVIMLGDYNDEITGADTLSNPFLNFINDQAAYTFTDLDIANGSALWWSYPSYPSHIDHIMVTNEVTHWVDTTFVVKASPCYAAYSLDISDHRPVGVRIIPGK